MPNERDGFTTVLDLGANVDCTAEHLLQFAVMGSALVAAVEGKEEPSVGLLNIGEEAIKGSETIKQAGELLRAAAAGGLLNFHGNVEGNDIFKGTTDIVVCDGFVGNVVLKTSEGLASMLAKFIKQEFTRNVVHARWPRCVRAAGAAPSAGARRPPALQRRARCSGLRGLVFKSHGSADAFAFEHALNRAYDAARNGLLDRVHDRIRATLAAMPAAAKAGEPTAFDTAPAACILNPTPLLPHHRHRQLPAAATASRNDDAGRTARRATASRPPSQWIVERTGIRARHFAAADVACSDLALDAAQRALEAADCDAADIDLIIVATSTPDMVFPSTACLVQQKLGIHGCAAFDVQAVCSGFVYALTVADSMIRTGSGEARRW